MNPSYEACRTALQKTPKRWLVTGGAGFIGSHLVDTLLRLGQEVACLDNFSSVTHANLDFVLGNLAPEQVARFQLITGDLANPTDCRKAVEGCDYVLHQGALGSVPLSIEDPAKTHSSNTSGTFQIFEAAREHGIQRVVYASSSAVYGNLPGLPKEESMPRQMLSPYAASKAIAEDYAESFAHSYGIESVGLRYFNVFGPRQDPSGAYAAVIPLWLRDMVEGNPIYINGDGENTRDFAFVSDVVQANLLAATTPSLSQLSIALNVGAGGRTSLKELFAEIRKALLKMNPDLDVPDPIHRDPRPGDVRHSYADISRIKEELEFSPAYDLKTGLEETLPWFLNPTDKATVS